MSIHRSHITLLLVFMTLSFMIPDAFARGRSSRSKTEWDKNAGECFQVFEEFDMVAKEQVAQCVATWAAYNSGDKLRASQRFILVKAFNFLFEKGDSAQS